jgi:hypothetical protein
MTDKYNKMMEDMVYRMISFMEDVVRAETDPVNRGRKILMKTVFLNEFNDILNKKNEIEKKIRENNYKDVETEYINIDIPKSDSDEIILIDELEVDSPIKKYDNTKIDKADKKQKKVSIEENQKGGSKNTKQKKPETKKQKINRKLNKLGADDVKKVGKEFNIKPETGKRYLTKSYVIDKVSKNTRLYGKVLDHVNTKYKDIVKTETENSAYDESSS